MPSTLVAIGLPLDQLAGACAEQTRRFSRHDPSDPQFCFELLRRALEQGLAEAFTWVCRVYERQVLRWVYQHPAFARVDEQADFFANAALTSFYFAVRGARFAQFRSLPALLAYLKACVHTAIAQYLRDQQKLAVLPLDETNAPAAVVDLAEEFEAAEIWGHICRLLPDARDRRLARCAFVLAMKPSQIVSAEPGDWQSEREISVALYRIRRLLRADPELQRRFGTPVPDA